VRVRAYRLEPCALYEECYHLRPLEETLREGSRQFWELVLDTGELVQLHVIGTSPACDEDLRQLSLDKMWDDGVEGLEREDDRPQGGPEQDEPQ